MDLQLSTGMVPMTCSYGLNWTSSSPCSNSFLNLQYWIDTEITHPQVMGLAEFSIGGNWDGGFPARIKHIHQHDRQHQTSSNAMEKTSLNE